MNWPGHKLAIGMFAAVLLATALAMAGTMLAGRASDEEAGTLLAVFPPSTRPNNVFGQIILAGGKPIRPTWVRGTWVVHGDEPGLRRQAQGARCHRRLPQLAGAAATGRVLCICRREDGSDVCHAALS
jgi:hypothetical protein